MNAAVPDRREIRELPPVGAQPGDRLLAQPAGVDFEDNLRLADQQGLLGDLRDTAPGASPKTFVPPATRIMSSRNVPGPDGGQSGQGRPVCAPNSSSTRFARRPRPVCRPTAMSRRMAVVQRAPRAPPRPAPSAMDATAVVEIRQRVELHGVEPDAVFARRTRPAVSCWPCVKMMSGWSTSSRSRFGLIHPPMRLRFRFRRIDRVVADPDDLPAEPEREHDLRHGRGAAHDPRRVGTGGRRRVRGAAAAAAGQDGQRERDNGQVRQEQVYWAVLGDCLP